MRLKDRIKDFNIYLVTYISDLLYFKNNDSYLPTKKFLPEDPVYDPDANHIRKLIYTLRKNEKIRNNLSLNGRNPKWLDEVINEEKNRIESILLNHNFSDNLNNKL